MTAVATAPPVSSAPVPTVVFPEVDAREFAAGFNHHPFVLRHTLAGHPSFTLERLVELGARLPKASVEYNLGDIPVGYGRQDGPGNGLSVAETIARIEECRSWMVLKNVEQDAEFKALLDKCLDELQPFAEELAPGMFLRMGFIFISSPGSMTPYHIDPENNFLMQIRGTKRVALFDPTDRALASQRDLERLFSGGHRNLDWQPAFEEKAMWFDLAPGEALHFPVHAPHFVKNGDAPSISFSITFQTNDSNRRRGIHWVNERLRRVGVGRPAMPGDSAFADSWKYGVYSTLRGAKRLLKGKSPR